MVCSYPPNGGNAAGFWAAGHIVPTVTKRGRGMLQSYGPMSGSILVDPVSLEMPHRPVVMIQKPITETSRINNHSSVKYHGDKVVLCIWFSQCIL